MRAYRQDFDAIATLLAGIPERVVDLSPDALTKDTLRTAFATYAHMHAAASIRRCWSNWNTLCDFLYSRDVIAANPMSLIGRPKVAKTLPKGLGAEAVSGLLAVIDLDHGSRRRSDWPSETGLSSSRLCSPDCGRTNWCVPTSAIFDPPMGEESSTSTVRETKIDEYL